eukprot:PITA_09423
MQGCNLIATPMEENLKLASIEGSTRISHVKVIGMKQSECSSIFKGTRTYGIKYSKVAYFHIIGYSDSDFDGDKENGVSTSFYLISLGSTTINWRSCKQYVHVDSTIEAKYVAETQATKEIIWLCKILEDLQKKQKDSTPLLINKSSAIQLAKNPKFHDQRKHINTKYHLIRHYVEAKIIHLTHCPTSKHIIYIFTKASGCEKFERFIMLLDMSDVPPD